MAQSLMRPLPSVQEAMPDKGDKYRPFGLFRLSKNPRGIGEPQPSDCQPETSGVYDGFGTLA